MILLCSQNRIVQRGLLFGSMFVVGVIMGCGVDTYQERLNKTKDYYNFLERIETNLAPKWTDGRVVEYIRVPKQFQPILPPVPVKNDEGKEELPAVDPRQPDFVNLVFPTSALVGAWDAPFEVALPDGSFETRKGYIYVLSNYWMFATEEPGKALEFTGIMIHLIGDALEERLPKEKLESPDIKMAPKRGGYLPEAVYSEFVYKPKPITLRESSVPYNFTAYARKNSNIFCVILVALPEGTSSKDKLAERIPMMLEQFAFTASEPRSGQVPAGPAQQNTGAAPLF